MKKHKSPVSAQDFKPKQSYRSSSLQLETLDDCNDVMIRHHGDTLGRLRKEPSGYRFYRTGHSRPLYASQQERVVVRCVERLAARLAEAKSGVTQAK